MPRLSRWLCAAVLLVAVVACRRRAPGTCADHVDCGPGFDCVEGRCSKRASINDLTAPAVAPAPAAEEPAAPPTPASPPSPGQSPSRPDARPDRPGPRLDPGPPPSENREPLWKQRRKNA